MNKWTEGLKNDSKTEREENGDKKIEPLSPEIEEIPNNKNLPAKDIILSSETQNGAQVQAEFMTDINDTSCGDPVSYTHLTRHKMLYI